MYELTPATEHNKNLFYSMDGEEAKRYGAIGYLRADFGKSGSEFWYSWFDIQSNLKTDLFKEGLDRVINALREDRQPLNNRRNLSAFVAAQPGMDLGERGLGYMVQTQNYTFYFRCQPTPTDYDVYCCIYDNYFLLSAE